MIEPKIMLTSFALTALDRVRRHCLSPRALLNVPDPGHPRINEVQQRIDNQQSRVDRGVSDGQINAKQAAHDDAKLGREQNSLEPGCGQEWRPHHQGRAEEFEQAA
jgi:hypothetical protein